MLPNLQGFRSQTLVNTFKLNKQPLSSSLTEAACYLPQSCVKEDSRPIGRYATSSSLLANPGKVTHSKLRFYIGIQIRLFLSVPLDGGTDD